MCVCVVASPNLIISHEPVWKLVMGLRRNAQLSLCGGVCGHACSRASMDYESLRTERWQDLHSFKLCLEKEIYITFTTSCVC